MTIVGIDGWIKILDRTDHYDGFEVEIHHDKHGNLDWVETAIYSTKRSKPSVYRAYQKEYVNLAGFMASRIPSHMLRIFSLRHAARNFVPLGATVVTEEEAAVMMRTSEPAPSSLDELTTRLMEPLKRDSDEASEGKEPEPQPTSEPVVDAPSHQAAFGECTTITEAGESWPRMARSTEFTCSAAWYAMGSCKLFDSRRNEPSSLSRSSRGVCLGAPGGASPSGALKHEGEMRIGPLKIHSFAWWKYMWKLNSIAGLFRNQKGVIPGRWGFYFLGLEFGSRNPGNWLGRFLWRIGAWRW